MISISPEALSHRLIQFRSEEKLATVSNRCTLLATLCLMAPEMDPRLREELLEETLSSNRSLYAVLEERNPEVLSLAARVTYFFFHTLGILHKVLDTVFFRLLDRTREALAPAKQPFLIERALSHVNSFLYDYLKALDLYANRGGQGSREEQLSLILNEKQFAHSDLVCKEFAQTLLRECLPEIPFFEEVYASDEIDLYSDLKMFGRIVTYLPEKLLNWVLHKSLETLLPQLIHSQIQSNLSLFREPSFALSITTALLDAVKEFHRTIQETLAAVAPDEVYGTQDLMSVVQQFIEILNRQPYQTREELQNYLSSWRLEANPLVRFHLENIFFNAGKSALAQRITKEQLEEALSTLFDRAQELGKAQELSDPDQQRAELKQVKEALSLEVRVVSEIVLNYFVQEEFKKIPMDPKSSLTGTAFGLGTAFFGPVGGAFASSLTLIGLKEGGDAGQQFALKKGLQIFENLYQFLLQPLVWKWALFDAMRLVNESCKAIKQTIY